MLLFELLLFAIYLLLSAIDALFFFYLQLSPTDSHVCNTTYTYKHMTYILATIHRMLQLMNASAVLEWKLL